jgi:hypothetical protein
MPRRQINFSPGGYYHLYNRGKDRQTIFLERKSYLDFYASSGGTWLGKMSKTPQRLGIFRRSGVRTIHPRLCSITFCLTSEQLKTLEEKPSF